MNHIEDLVFDVGMHTGRDTEFYLRKGFRVVAIEANPSLVSRARKKFKDYIDNKRLIIIDRAIAASDDKELTFYVNTRKDDWGTLIPEWNRGMSDEYKPITVNGIALPEILEEYGNPIKDHHIDRSSEYGLDHVP